MKLDNNIEILDLTPDLGVASIFKSAMTSVLQEEGYNVKKSNVTPPPAKTYILNIRLWNLFKFSFQVTSDLVLGIFILSKLALYPTRSRNEFISKCLEIKYRDLLVGDCIISAYFRKPQTSIFPVKSLHTYGFIFLSILLIGYQVRFLKQKCKNSDSRKKMFFNFETTGFPEVWRRFLISQNIPELRFSIFHQKLRIFHGHNGVDLRQGFSFRRDLYRSFSEADIQNGRLTLDKLVSRKLKYAYLKSLDVDPSSKIETLPFSNKSTVILFLSTISDAQYVYGQGPYADLHDFQEGIIEAALDSGFNVVVKPHPAMFKDKDFTVKDRNYFEWLQNKWKVSPYCLGLMRSNVNQKLFFSDSRIATNELKRIFPGFLCVTQHGTVAVECAFNGLFSIVGSNSKYFEGDEFVRILYKKIEIFKLFSEWQKFTEFSLSERESIYKFSAINNIKCRPIYATRLFQGVIPKDLDSWQVESWLKSYVGEYKNQRTELLENSCKKFIRGQGIDLKNVLFRVLDTK